MLICVDWWLRSPNVTNSNNVRNVNTDGSLNNNNANNVNGVAPDCVESECKVSPMGGNQSATLKEHLSQPVKRRRFALMELASLQAVAPTYSAGGFYGR